MENKPSSHDARLSALAHNCPRYIVARGNSDWSLLRIVFDVALRRSPMRGVDHIRRDSFDEQNNLPSPPNKKHTTIVTRFPTSYNTDHAWRQKSPAHAKTQIPMARVNIQQTFDTILNSHSDLKNTAEEGNRKLLLTTETCRRNCKR